MMARAMKGKPPLGSGACAKYIENPSRDLSIFEDHHDSRRRSRACIDHASSLTDDWEKELLANGVMSVLATGRLRQPPVMLSYREPPVIAKTDRSSGSVAFLAAQRRRASVSAPSGEGSL